MRIVDEGIISRRSERNAYMPELSCCPTARSSSASSPPPYFTASDAKIEILRSTDGLSTWTNEGEIKGAAAAEEGWSYRGARIYQVPDGRLLLKTTRFDSSKISPDLRRVVRDTPAAGEHYPLVRRRRPHVVRAAARRCPDRSVEAHRQWLRRPAPNRPRPLDVPAGDLEAGRLRRAARPEGARPLLVRTRGPRGAT